MSRHGTGLREIRDAPRSSVQACPFDVCDERSSGCERAGKSRPGEGGRQGVPRNSQNFGHPGKLSSFWAGGPDLEDCHGDPLANLSEIDVSDALERLFHTKAPVPRGAPRRTHEAMMTETDELAVTGSDYDDVAPNASAMIESMRAYGYTLPTAIADLIDNSIAAGCKTVWLRVEWNGGDPWISITDDGNGMTEQELIAAMRLGSQSPIHERAEKDLGRFGLGLKTASFSQARRLSVITRTKPGTPSQRRWDLDHLARPDVTGWQLLWTLHPHSLPRATELDVRKLDCGTQVLLEEMDRLALGSTASSSGKQTEDHFVKVVERVRVHLAMVFHRFLADPPASRVQIFLNEDPIKPWDPFVENHPATQGFAADRFRGGPHTEKFQEVEVTGFVLPHRDRFDETDPKHSVKMHAEASGPLGWNAQQGFYLYRNRRLIIAGDWLGLGPGNSGWKKEEHFKLARIRLDIPNSMDQEWQIDVKKSTALAPAPVRSWLQGLAKGVREKAKKVYAQRGQPRTRRRKPGTHDSPWCCVKPADGRFKYLIDRKNEVLKALIGALPSDGQKRLDILLRLIEETVPIQPIWIDMADNQDGVAGPFEGESDNKIQQYIQVCLDVLRNGGCSAEDSWELVSTFEAFRGRAAQAIIGAMREQQIR